MKIIILIICLVAINNSFACNAFDNINNLCYENFQTILLKEHNQERLNKGLSPLTIDKNLCEYAQKHADNMSKKSRMYHSKMNDLRNVLDSNLVGENVAWGQNSEKEVVDAWMKSPGHRRNILNSGYKRVGFGMKEDKNNRKYWCVVFSD